MKITLCGSAKYEAYWHEANKLLGLAGHICYSLMTFPSIEGSKSWYTPDQKWMLDLAHFAKIEESDAVVMLNIDNYLGESSTRELLWARMRNKKVFWTIYRDNPRITETDFPVIGALIRKGSFRYGDNWNELLENVKQKQMPSAVSDNSIPHQQV
jgi:hypothetical protein